MSLAVENLMEAMKHAMSIRPKVGGFPYLAETLRRAGVAKNRWNLPSCQSLYLTVHGPVVNQGTPLVTGMFDVPKFDREALVHALRTDQEGRGTFPEFLQSAWKAGVVGYEVDFEKRHCVYFGAAGEEYLEEYPTAEVPGFRPR